MLNAEIRENVSVGQVVNPKQSLEIEIEQLFRLVVLHGKSQLSSQNFLP